MFFIAAFIEAFWSSTQVISPTIKYTVGGALWFLVFAYFMFVGRSQNNPLTEENSEKIVEEHRHES